MIVYRVRWCDEHHDGFFDSSHHATKSAALRYARATRRQLDDELNPRSDQPVTVERLTVGAGRKAMADALGGTFERIELIASLETRLTQRELYTGLCAKELVY